MVKRQLQILPFNHFMNNNIWKVVLKLKKKINAFFFCRQPVGGIHQRHVSQCICIWCKLLHIHFHEKFNKTPTIPCTNSKQLKNMHGILAWYMCTGHNRTIFDIPWINHSNHRYQIFDTHCDGMWLFRFEFYFTFKLEML